MTACARDLTVWTMWSGSKRPRFRAAAAAIGAALAVCGSAQPARAVVADPGAVWLPLKDQSLTVADVPRSALNLGAALGAPAPAESLATGRHLCATVATGIAYGGIGDHAASQRLADELQAGGYRVVRFHFIDALLMAGRTKDFDFDPVQLDRLHFLMAELKKRGIGWIVDGLTSDNGAYGGVFPHRFIRRFDAKIDALTTDAGFAHWRMLVDHLWGARNPYTGLPTLKDPALQGVIAVNEGALDFLATTQGQQYNPKLQQPFNAWLRARYGNDDALRSAWGGALGPGESLAGNGNSAVYLPERLRGENARHRDFALFERDAEQAAFARMQSYLRAQGFAGPVTALDNWNFLGTDVARSALPWVDMHAYHDTPTAHGEPGSQIKQSSLFDTTGLAPRTLAVTRQWGKPFTVTEYGQPFWNQYRYEMAALLPAMAAHQGWNLICQFAESPVQFDYGPSPFRRQQAIYPYGVGADPIARAGDRLAAMLYQRGDVRTSPNRVRLYVDPDAVFARQAGWEQMPAPLSMLSLVAPVGLAFQPSATAPAAGEVTIPVFDGNSPWVASLKSAMTRAGVGWDNRGIDSLRAAGILSSSNRTRPDLQRFESDTGQLYFDGRARQILIDTPRTAVIVTPGTAAATSNFEVRTASGDALFAVSSLDGAPIAQSRRLLVWVLTDAMNTDMRFRDTGRTTLESIGHFPPVVRTIAASLRINSANAQKVKVWPLSLSGKRRGEIPIVRSGDAIQIDLDTATLPDGPALYFEIAVDAP